MYIEIDWWKIDILIPLSIERHRGYLEPPNMCNERLYSPVNKYTSINNICIFRFFIKVSQTRLLSKGNWYANWEKMWSKLWEQKGDERAREYISSCRKTFLGILLSTKLSNTDPGISNYIVDFLNDAITYPFPDLALNVLVKRALAKVLA